MESLREFYKIGNGPSSSHTMGPERASSEFKKIIFSEYNLKNIEEVNEKFRYKIELYGSLAATGKGHLTDYIIKKVLYNKKEDNVEVVFKPEIIYKFHTNGMKIKAYNIKDMDYSQIIKEKLYFSVGGGSIVEKPVDLDINYEENNKANKNYIYKEKNFNEILEYCKNNKINLIEYVEKYEGMEIWSYLKEIWKVMEESVDRGLVTEGNLPGKLNLKRKAKTFYEKFKTTKFKNTEGRVYSYALAASEENASAGKVVTAPTCGASGIIPALLKTYQKENDLSEEEIIKALMVAGIIGNLYKRNASISGAEVGCQGEVGVACSMGAGMVAYILGGDLGSIEYAAEIAMEHCLGMTCDPMLGYVQIPCIERNAIYAAKAINCASYSLMSGNNNLVSLDEVMQTMLETGKDLNENYKETSLAGLAKLKKEKLDLK